MGKPQHIEGFSHLFVLWVFHRSGGFDLVAHVPLDERRPHGVFSTRSPRRPNPIGLSVVELLGREGPVLRVRGLDMLDGTPILDLKPYHPAVDRIRGAGTPEWCRHWPQWYEDSADFDWSAEFNFS